jgi:hypothetical protein
MGGNDSKGELNQKPLFDPNRNESKTILKNNGRYIDLYRIEADPWK